MGDTKPLGSEKLNGDEKLKRILELTYFDRPKKSNNQIETIKESASGVFGIVKEKDGYYVKKGLNESSLDYIGGLFMKNKNKFSSYAEALKRMDLLAGQETIQEATKYVLKQSPKPKEEAPMAQSAMPEVPAETPPTTEVPAEPTDISGKDDMNSPEGEDQMTSKRSDYMAEIQKYAGKLGQQLRDEHQRLESDDIKYVLNMVISAVDLDKLDPEDLDEVAKKFERDEEEGDEIPQDDPGAEEIPAEEPETNSNELGENMRKLSQFINSKTPAAQENEIDLSKYADLGNVKEEDKTEEIDLEEIKKEINGRIGETLSKYFK